MKTITFAKIVKFICAVGVLSAAPVQADVTYSYTGNPFSFFTVGSTYTTSDSVNGFVQFVNPLSPNMPPTLLTPIFFVLNDGEQSIAPNSSNPSVDSFLLSTGPLGEITSWQIIVAPLLSGGHIEVFSPAYGGYDDVTSGNPDNEARSFRPGSWTSDAPSVPEPHTAALLALYLALIGLAARRFKRAGRGTVAS